jgi:hypothetical protein
MLDDYDFFAKLSQVRPDAPQNFDDIVRGYFIYNAELLLQKHRDYGPSNIADAPGGPINGLRVRMHDKMARINHLVDNNQEAVNEPLRDSFMDLANYAMIGLLVLDGKWPKK